MNLYYILNQLHFCLQNTRTNLETFKKDNMIVIKVGIALIINIAICNTFNISMQLSTIAIMTASYQFRISQEELISKLILNNIIGSFMGGLCIYLLNSINNMYIVALITFIGIVCSIYYLCIEHYFGSLIQNSLIIFMLNDSNSSILYRFIGFITGYILFSIVCILFDNTKEKVYILKKIKEIRKCQQQISFNIIEKSYLDNIDIIILEDLNKNLLKKIQANSNDLSSLQMQNLKEFINLIQDFILLCNICKNKLNTNITANKIYCINAMLDKNINKTKQIMP